MFIHFILFYTREGHYKKILKVIAKKYYLVKLELVYELLYLTHYFLIYSKTMTNIFFYPFINLFISITNEVFVLSVK